MPSFSLIRKICLRINRFTDGLQKHDFLENPFYTKFVYVIFINGKSVFEICVKPSEKRLISKRFFRITEKLGFRYRLEFKI